MITTIVVPGSRFPVLASELNLFCGVIIKRVEAIVASSKKALKLLWNNQTTIESFFGVIKQRVEAIVT